MHKRNPPLVTYGNPRHIAVRRETDIIARNVAAIIYRHDVDGDIYVHPFGNGHVPESGKVVRLSDLDFGSNVRAIAMRDGSVRLVHADGLTLWGEY